MIKYLYKYINKYINKFINIQPGAMFIITTILGGYFFKKFITLLIYHMFTRY